MTALGSAVRLWGCLVAASLRSQLQYRASLVLQTLGHLAATSIEFVAIYYLFRRFDHLDGWTLPEVAVFYGLISFSFAIADALSRGFDLFADQVRGGGFDRLLLRPCPTALQLLGQELTLKRAGRLLQGAVVTGWGLMELGLSPTPASLVLLSAIVVGNVTLFMGLVVIQATLCFWTVESLEAMNAFVYGGSFAARYPMSIYDRWLRRIFTWVVPLTCTNYFPVVALLGREDPLGSPAWWQWVSPAMGPLFLLAALCFWRCGERHYRSTGS